MTQPTPIYLDCNATTPLDPAVFEAMRPYFFEHFGNPSSVEHVYGVNAARAVDQSRGHVARAINANPSEIIFTGSCTESDNLAILGVGRGTPGIHHFITTSIEHPAVLEAFRQLEREGHAVTYLPVDDNARIQLEQLESAFRADTLLVSIMGANNEVGTLQPLVEIGRLCAEKKVLFHSDMAQMASCVSIDVQRVGVHLASFSAHKAYGPKGIGALYIRRCRPRIALQPLYWGGGQERALRPGTLNTPLIVGMGEAMRIADDRRGEAAVHIASCFEALKVGLSDQLEGIVFNGHPVERIQTNLSLSIEGVEPLALMRLVRDDVSFSASSACSTHEVKTSHVLLAMFGDCPRARGAFRLSPGRFTTVDQIEQAISSIKRGVARLRSIR